MNLLCEFLDVVLLDLNVWWIFVLEGKIWLYLFCGLFELEDDLLVYCFDVLLENEVELLIKDLLEVFVDIIYVVIGYECGVGEVLVDFFMVEELDEVFVQIGGKNSLVILLEYVFGGMDYSLNDIFCLCYLGVWFVDLL